MVKWRFLILCALAAAGSTGVFAATLTLTNDTNWSAIGGGSGPGGQPNNTDDIVVKRGAILTVNVATGQCASIQLSLDTGPPGQRGNGTLIFNAGSQVTVSGPVTLGDNTNAGATTGTINMAAGGNLILDGFTVSVFGAWTPGSGSVQLRATNTLPTQFNVNGYNNLTVNGAATTTTLSGSTPVTGNLTVTAGTLDLGAFTANRTAAGGTISIAAGATLKIGGTNSFPSNYSTRTLNALSTVEYSGAAQIVTADTYGHLVLSGSGSKTIGTAAGQTVTVAGSLSVGSGVTYDGATRNPVVNLGGDLTDNGTFNAGTGTYTFNGTAAQLLTGSTSNTVFRNLTLNNANGLSLSGTHNAQVSVTLTLTSGRITTNANVLYMQSGGTINNAGGSNFIVGNLKKRFTTGANVARVFEVGTEVGAVIRYAPVSTLNFGNVTTAGDFTVSTTAGDHPNIGTSTLDPAKSVNRYWTLTNDSVVFDASASNQIVYTFVAGDIDGGVNTANVLASRFSPALPGAGSWTEITPSARTATTTTISGTGITTANVGGDYQIAEKSTFVVPTSFNAFETSTAANAITGRVFSKLAGTAFKVDVVAILSGAQHTLFNTTTKKVLVDLVTGSAGGDSCPGSPVAVSGTSQTMDLVSGRGTTGNFTVATALRDVRVRMRYPDDVPTVTACSTDNFSIRPNGFASVTSNMTNSATSGTPVIKAGAAFTITAVALAGYDGTPAIDSTLLSAHAGAVQVGAISGTFAAANSTSGTALASAVTYGEVGNFTIATNGVFDSAFTGVDQAGGDCTNDFSNALVGGKYGCKFGNTAATAPIGRFTPDHFDVDLTTTPPVFDAGCVGGGFTYLGQSFSYGTQPKIYITAKNVANVVTKNYTGSWWKIATGTLTGKTYAAQTGTLDTSGLPLATVDPTVLDTGNGTGTLTFSSGTGLSFTRTTTVASFNAELTLSINVIDADNVIYASNPARFGAASAGNGISFNGGKAMRFGRLAIANRSGSQLLPLQIPIEAQYWNGTTFVTNMLDSCTPVAPANVAMGSYSGSIDPAAGPPANCKTVLSGGGTLTSGRGNLQLSAPASQTTGSVTLTVNLGASASGSLCTAVGAPPGAATTANRTYLQGNWTGATFDQNPIGRETFGVYRGADEVIYTRENF